jgi:hypothetical protein
MTLPAARALIYGALPDRPIAATGPSKTLYVSTHAKTVGFDAQALGAAVEQERGGAIGCRDAQTLELLRSNGIPAYFSGCLTLTLSAARTRGNRPPLLLNVPDDLLSYLPSAIKRAARSVSPPAATLPPAAAVSEVGVREQVRAARRLLREIANSSLVVTNVLDFALPSVALGKPTVLICNDVESVGGAGYEEFVYAVPIQQVIDDPGSVNWSPTRRSVHEPLAQSLARRCHDFASNLQLGGRR